MISLRLCSVSPSWLSAAHDRRPKPNKVPPGESNAHTTPAKARRFVQITGHEPTYRSFRFSETMPTSGSPSIACCALAMAHGKNPGGGPRRVNPGVRYHGPHENGTASKRG
jgi:hypothetical protein